MANKKITELVKTTTINDSDLLLLETAEGTRSILFSDIKKLFDSEPRPFADNAAAHNGIFRGKDLTDLGIEEICSRISSGSFEDLYIGDYFDIIISTSYTQNEKVRCILAGFDIYWNNGDTAFTRHHAVIVPKNCFNKKTSMNATSTVEGGFVGSYIWETILPIYKDALQSTLGNHILMHRTLLTTTTDANLNSNAIAGFKGASSGWAWTDTYLSLLSEIQVYGSNILSSSFYDIGCDNLQLPLFALDPTAKVCGVNTATDENGDGSRQWYWLRNVVSSVNFAGVNNYGFSGHYFAAGSGGVRPLFCIG